MSCPSCGAKISADSPQGLCPACLLKKGLEPPSGGTPRRCSACQSVLAEDARFCAYCAAPAPAARAEQGDPVRAALEAKLQGQYRIVRLLGRGGMGAVYLARDLTLDREVAIKVVKTEADSREVYDRFRREAKTAAKLSHPNIVPLHAFGEVEGMPYFVMGYVRGESLETRLRRDGRLPEEEGRRVVAEIADALDHAHRQGVVHRDVKPDNVLLEDESGRALLTDFGVAKALGKGDTLTRAGSVVGTPHYMSPEQAAGRADIDSRSDIYSLGVMAYGMLAGRLPFEGKSHAEILSKHLTQDPPPLRSLAATVSDATAQAVERCLAKDPAHRWQDARSLKLALGSTDESQLPDALQGVEGKGMLVAGIAMILPFIWMLGRVLYFGVVAVYAAIVAFIYLFALMRLRGQGISAGQSQRSLWREPVWWPFWYPRALRRPGNVWDRLPDVVKLLRWWVPALSVYTFVFLWLAFGLGLRRGGRIGGLGIAGVIVLTFLWLGLSARAKSALKRGGLGPEDSLRVMVSVPPSRRSFWARPHIEAVLLPAAPARSLRPESPHDQLQSILRHADELSGPLRPLGAEAAAAARQLLAAIEHAEREIAELARNLEPGEDQRLSDKIEALAGEEAAPMRQLLEKQLELVRGLQGRVEEAKAARNRRVEMLKTLALHVASLRARATEPPAELRSVSERVRTLCDEIARQALALTDARSTVGAGVDKMATLDRRPDGDSRP